MSKRRVGRVGRKATAARRRDGVTDLSARKARGVRGGLLPVLRASPERTRAGDDYPTETITFAYQKVK